MIDSRHYDRYSMLIVIAGANSSILATEPVETTSLTSVTSAASRARQLSIHELIVIIACSATCLIIVVTTLAVIATQRSDQSLPSVCSYVK